MTLVELAKKISFGFILLLIPQGVFEMWSQPYRQILKGAKRRFQEAQGETEENALATEIAQAIIDFHHTNSLPGDVPGSLVKVSDNVVNFM